ncbi:type II secretion system protein [Noviherbaspirillum pedocola]|uniref:Type II secretion system protein n=1 Tax=Noviherbaspirillum pedocola TaxID=2801341 RepID=A0A934SZW5_9BURK|nr:type II secretion system protein [Noviherbaspirillum pedocola]MBK4735824.1 type II secretion system protein [Noviherbaspirillum pedocola]
MKSRSRNERGLALLALLLGLALLGIGLLREAQSWSLLRQREAERELLWVGEQYRKAIERYYWATPGAAKAFPTRLEDLLEDRRGLVPQHHLRRLYRDPINGGEFTSVQSGLDIIGVASASSGRPFKRTGFDAPGFDDKDSYAEWQFVFRPPPRARATAPAQHSPPRAPLAGAAPSTHSTPFSLGAKP